jgi:hypothetical protein
MQPPSPAKIQKRAADEPADPALDDAADSSDDDGGVNEADFTREDAARAAATRELIKAKFVEAGETRPMLTTSEVAERLEAFANTIVGKKERVVLKLSEDCYHTVNGVRAVVCSAKLGVVPAQNEGMRFFGRSLLDILHDALGIERADTGERLYTKRARQHDVDEDLWVEGAGETMEWLAGNLYNGWPKDQHASIVANPDYEVTANCSCIRNAVIRNAAKRARAM